MTTQGDIVSEFRESVERWLKSHQPFSLAEIIIITKRSLYVRLESAENQEFLSRQSRTNEKYLHHIEHTRAGSLLRVLIR